MSSKVKPIPEGYHTVTTYLAVSDIARAIDFYRKAFGAKETARINGPGGKLMHAEVQIGDSRVMLGSEQAQRESCGHGQAKGCDCSLVMYVEDADEAVARAVDAGASQSMPVSDQFWGDRMGQVADPFGHVWSIATHVEDVSPEEMARAHRTPLPRLTSSAGVDLDRRCGPWQRAGVAFRERDAELADRFSNRWRLAVWAVYNVAMRNELSCLLRSARRKRRLLDARRIVVLALAAALIAPVWSSAQSGPGLDDYPDLGGPGDLLGPQPSIAAGKLKVHAVASDTRIAHRRAVPRGDCLRPRRRLGVLQPGPRAHRHRRWAGCPGGRT